MNQPLEFWDADVEIKRVQAPKRDGQMVWMWRTSRSDEGLTTAAASAFESFSELAAPVISQALAGYPPGGTVVSALFPLLPAGGIIPPHRDVAPLLRKSHRIHVPLVVNPEVYFFVDGVRFPLEEGVPFELPNQLPHSVQNRGTEARIHLLFDYLPEESDSDFDPPWVPEVLRPSWPGNRSTG